MLKQLSLQVILVSTTSVNRVILTMIGYIIAFIYMTNYGTESNVKVPAVQARSFHHGLVYSFLLQQTTQLKCTFAVMNLLIMNIFQ